MNTAGGTITERAAIDAAFTVFLSELAGCDPRTRIALSAQYRERINAIRLTALAEVAGVDEKHARAEAVLADGAATSHRSRRLDARRAVVLAANPGLAAAVELGAVNVESIDELAKAANKDDGLIPDELVADAADAAPDQVRRLVRRHLADRVAPDEVNELHERQHDNRRAKRYNTNAADGTPLAGLAIEGPTAIIDHWYALLCAEANAAYQAAGGREQAANQHLGFPARLFDSVGLFFGGAVGHPGAGTADGMATAPANSTGRGAGGGPAAGSGRAGPQRRRSRADVVITVPVEPGAAAYGADGRPVPDAVVEHWLQEARLGVAFTDLDGRPLWMGRIRRHATASQRLALIVRDRGCVLCNAPVRQCESHHTMPWEAPGRGPTDIDNLALLCQRCHRDLHQRNHTLVSRRQPSGVTIWATRPALAHETPPAPISRGSDPP